jgi:hypothetical protein
MTASQPTGRLTAAVWLTIRPVAPAVRDRWPAGRHVGSVLAVNRIPGHRAGPLARTPSVGAPRLTGSHLPIPTTPAPGTRRDLRP